MPRDRTRQQVVDRAAVDLLGHQAAAHEHDDHHAEHGDAGEAEIHGEPPALAEGERSHQLGGEQQRDPGGEHAGEHAVARRLAEGVARDHDRDHAERSTSRATASGVAAAAAASSSSSSRPRCGVTARSDAPLLISHWTTSFRPRLVGEQERGAFRVLEPGEHGRERRWDLEQRRARAADLDRVPAVGHQLVNGRGARQPSAGEDRHPITERLDVGQDVRGEQHGDAALALLYDQLADVAAAERVETAHRLVQHQEIRLVHERGGEAETLEHALRVLAQHEPRPVAEADAGPASGVPAASLRARRAPTAGAARSTHSTPFGWS